METPCICPACPFSINSLEALKVQFLVLQHFVIVEKVSGLLLVKLAFENVDLVGECLQLVIKLSLSIVLVFFAIVRALNRTITAIGNSLSFCLLIHDGLFASCFIKLSREEVLVCVQVLIKVDNVLKGYLVRAPPHRFLSKPSSLFLVTCVVHPRFC